jgi:nondiscriminating glutamyl-tRNA synthetase
MKLLETGHAYPDYMTKEELDAQKKAAEAEKKSYVHRGPLRDMPAAECLRLYKERPTTLRFKTPLNRLAVVEDLICGHCEQKTDLIGDPVIMRAPDPDGTVRPLYNFASVVDDIQMKITHVVRAREHLSNTYSQVLFFEALGDDLPKFGHVPVVNEPAPKPGAVYPPGVKPPNPKKKLSKREMAKFLTAEIRAKLRAIGWTDEQIDQRDDLNPATVAFYREMGYLPAGLVNYLGRLGWSLDDKAEYIPLDQMIAHFSLERVNDSPASFDPDKLDWLAGEYMKQLPLADKVAGCLPFLRRAKLIGAEVDKPTQDKLEQLVAACGDRLKLFSDILPFASQLMGAEPKYDPKAVEKRLKKPGAGDLLREFALHLQKVDPWNAPTLEKSLHEFCAAKGIKIGEMVHPVRVATTGVEIGIGLFDILAILGRDESARRIKNALNL